MNNHNAKMEPRSAYPIANAIDELNGLRALHARISTLADTLLGSHGVSLSDDSAKEPSTPSARLPALEAAALEAREYHCKIAEQLNRIEQAIG